MTELDKFVKDANELAKLVKTLADLGRVLADGLRSNHQVVQLLYRKDGVLQLTNYCEQCGFCSWSRGCNPRGLPPLQPGQIVRLRAWAKAEGGEVVAVFH